MNDIKSDISRVANELRMPLFSDYEQFINPKKPFADNLLVLLSEQARLAAVNRVQRRIKYAGFPQIKTLDTFEMSKENLPALNFDELRDMSSCAFIDDKLDVVAIGPPGRGKTHLALAFGFEAVKRGYTVRFKRAADMINEMNEAKSDKKLADYIRLLNRCQLLIIDELGYLNYDLNASSLFFQIIGARYENSSTFYTTNLEFSKWPHFIGDEGLATAIVDRIAHHSIILNMNGPGGWRLAHAHSAKMRPSNFSSPMSGGDSIE
jgi:DNA replication protein DnaC